MEIDIPVMKGRKLSPSLNYWTNRYWDSKLSATQTHCFSIVPKSESERVLSTFE